MSGGSTPPPPPTDPLSRSAPVVSSKDMSAVSAMPAIRGRVGEGDRKKRQGLTHLLTHGALI